MTAKLDKPGYTRTEAAAILGVTVSRVSQIAKSMNIGLSWKRYNGFNYSQQQVRRMMQRNVKPGPKGKSK